MIRKSNSRTGRQSLPRSVIELLEARQLLSTSTLRIVAYNIEDDINGNTTPLPGLYQVLEGIGEEKVQGNVRPIDVLGLEETTSNADVQPIVTNLNSYYNGSAVYAESTYQGTQDGGNTDGNGPNAMVYNSSTLKLLASVGVGTPGGSSNGEYRQPIRYEFQPVGDSGTTGVFYIYVMHTKSGTGTTNATYRGEEAKIVRNDEATLPSTASVIYMGDLNANAPEAEFTNFEASGQGEAYDPFGYATSPTKAELSDSATSLSYRDDYQLMTSNIYNDTGAINYVTGSFHNFANNGSVTDPASSSNTALNSDLVTDGGTFIPASTIYTDIGTASDHLPVVSDYTFTTTAATPTIGSFAVAPTSVATGGSITFTASNVTETGGTISNVKFYEETNGTTGYQSTDTLVGTGTASGTTYTLSTTAPSTAGTYTYYAVATDSSGVSSAASSTTLTVTSSGGGGGTGGAQLAWDVNGQTNYGASPLAATTVATGLTNSTGLTRGSGVATSGTAAANAWGGTAWASTSSAGISGSETVSFGLTVGSGYTDSLSSIALNYRRSSTGPSSGYWQYEIGTGAFNLISDVSNEFSSTSSSGAAITPLSLTGITALQGLAAGTKVTFRLTPYASTSSSGTWYIYNETGNDLVVSGTTTTTNAVKAVTPAATTSSSSSPFAENTSLYKYLLDGEL